MNQSIFTRLSIYVVISLQSRFLSCVTVRDLAEEIQNRFHRINGVLKSMGILEQSRTEYLYTVLCST